MKVRDILIDVIAALAVALVIFFNVAQWLVL